MNALWSFLIALLSPAVAFLVALGIGLSNGPTEDTTGSADRGSQQQQQTDPREK